MIELFTVTGCAILGGFVVTKKRGPFDVFLRLREYIHRLYPDSFGDKAIRCPFCMAFWFAQLTNVLLLVAPNRETLARALGGFAGAGLCILILAMSGLLSWDE